MKKKTASLKALRVAFVTIAFMGSLAGVAWAPALASSDVTATTISTTPVVAGGLITSGSSRSECLTPNVSDTGLTAIQSAITKFDRLTGTSVSCLSAYLNGAPMWSSWEHPWITESQFGYTSWVAEAPRSRELVLQVDLIPTALKNIKNPFNWESSCAAGNFTAYAMKLGTNLVAAGLENSVIRLGAEMNGNWEVDYVGTTQIEHQLWIRCFDNEVVGLRHALGEHFLIDWNPNPCQNNLPYSKLYPGNSYVNIIGLDLFDVSCIAPKTPYTFAKLANEPAGLIAIDAFATVHHKTMSLPEWGLAKNPSGDDPNFIDGIGSVFDTKDFAFETYFDVRGNRLVALPLGPRTPLSIAAFHKWFSSSAKP
jgi:hypothetical protein